MAGSAPQSRAVRVAWDRLRRVPANRTSAPTQDTIKALQQEVGDARGGSKPIVDTVLLAALRLANPTRLLVEVERIERELFDVPPAARK